MVSRGVPASSNQVATVWRSECRPLPLGRTAIDGREQGGDLLAAPDGRDMTVPRHADLGDVGTEILRKDPSQAEEAQEGPQVGDEDRNRLGSEMDLRTDKGREVCSPKCGKVTHLLRLQEVKKAREMAGSAAHGSWCA